MTQQDPIANLFFGSETPQRSYKTPYKAQQVILWKCQRCGANLLTSERRGAKINGTTVTCSNCGAENELQEIAWRGQT